MLTDKRLVAAIEAFISLLQELDEPQFARAIRLDQHILATTADRQQRRTALADLEGMLRAGPLTLSDGYMVNPDGTPNATKSREFTRLVERIRSEAMWKRLLRL